MGKDLPTKHNVSWSRLFPESASPIQLANLTERLD